METDQSKQSADLYRILCEAEAARVYQLIWHVVQDEPTSMQQYLELQEAILGREFDYLRSPAARGMRDRARVILGHTIEAGGLAGLDELREDLTRCLCIPATPWDTAIQEHAASLRRFDFPPGSFSPYPCP